MALHDLLQALLVERLRTKGVTSIKENLEYSVLVNGRRLIGEVDVLTEPSPGVFHFYEIKSCSRKVRYAQQQYDRFRRAFPELNIKGIYFSPTLIKRLDDNAPE